MIFKVVTILMPPYISLTVPMLQNIRGETDINNKGGKAPNLLSLFFFYIYSERKVFTGFASAALTAWILMVIRAISRAVMPAKAKIHQSRLILYS